MEDRKLLTIQLDTSDYLKIEQIAENEDRSISSVVRRAVKDYIKNYLEADND